MKSIYTTVWAFEPGIGKMAHTCSNIERCIFEGLKADAQRGLAGKIDSLGQSRS